MRRISLFVFVLALAAPAQEAGLTASQLLPGELLKSDHHQVREAVTVDGRYFQFQVESDFGLYEVDSMNLLRIRVHEIATLANVIEKNQGKEYFRALGGRLKQTVTAPVKLVKDPVGSVKSVGKSVGKTVKGIGGIFRKREKSEYEDRGKRAVIASHKRRLAAELDLDVYSTNPKVQEFLNDVATARFAGSMTFSLATFAIPGAAGTVVGTASYGGRVKHILRDKSPKELHAYNNKKLRGMVFDTQLINEFLTHPWLSPRHQTVIVANLEALEGVEGRETILEAALDTEREARALAHEERSRVLAYYHVEKARIAKLTMTYGGPVAHLANGDNIVVVPIDIGDWTDESAQIVDEVRAAGRRWHIYFSGILTERARRELDQVKAFKVFEQYRPGS